MKIVFLLMIFFIGSWAANLPFELTNVDILSRQVRQMFSPKNAKAMTNTGYGLAVSLGQYALGGKNLLNFFIDLFLCFKIFII